jgi:hypothetical protein
MAVDINGDGLIALGGTSTTQGRVRLAEDTDNGTNYVELTSNAAITTNRTVTFPDADINFTTGLGVAQGGTGAATLTANNVIIGNGTSAVTFVAPGTTGNVLTSNGTVWASTAPAAPSAPTTAQVLTALSGISSAGGVGNLCVGSYASSSNILVGNTTAGSNIIGLDSAGSASAPFSGTWRNLGTSTLGTSAFSAAQPLFVRIS